MRQTVIEPALSPGLPARFLRQEAGNGGLRHDAPAQPPPRQSGPDHFACSAAGQGFLDEIRGAGPARIVVAGRPTPAQHLPNGDIAGRRLGLRDGILARFSRQRGQAAGAGGGMVETTPMTALHPDARWQRTQP